MSGLLRQELQRLLAGKKTVVLGIGREGCGDDAVGPLLAQRLGRGDRVTALVAEELPENYTEPIRRLAPQTILLVDAVDFNGFAGQVVLLREEELTAVSCSAHHASLRPLMRYLSLTTGAQIRLLGVQPDACRPQTALSQPVSETLSVLHSLLSHGETEEETSRWTP
ncbi:MAG TPA: hydrogenase maturation protease [bacterium]|nr:hydrogenase maturation protease [bacterium]HPN33781.1 hydrogenase maturation protease [bacterium]